MRCSNTRFTDVFTLDEEVTQSFRYAVTMASFTTAAHEKNTFHSKLTPFTTVYGRGLLQEIKDNYKKYSPKEWGQRFIQKINAVSPFKAEYLTFADANTLQPVNDWNDAEQVRAFASVYCNDVRLIDNMEIK